MTYRRRFCALLLSCDAALACSDGEGPGVTGSSGGSAGASSNAGGTDNAGGASLDDASVGPITDGSTGGAINDAPSEPAIPTYEQDDPNLIPPETAYQKLKVPTGVTNVMSIDIDADERVFILER